jgi:GntR family transcriptional regulator/MocR family aminotransferase
MAIQWTGLSPEVLLPLDRDGGGPLRTQIERGLREAIRTGRLHAGERLPSTRELARGLGVSRGIVVDCFDQLTAEGFLVARPGSATIVSPTAHTSTAPAPRPPAPAPARMEIDFVPAMPDLSAFPRTDWAKTVAEVCRTMPSTALGYDDPRGTLTLRTVLSAYLARVRGASAGPDRLVVSTGFSQGLNISLYALAARGIRHVAFEDPGYDETGRIACAWAGLTQVAVPVDDEGIQVDALAATGARAVVLTPAHQWPTGVVLSPARRQALAAWAASTGGWIIEDDYDAEFRYDRDPVGALQGLAPDRVIHIGTVSKSLAPTLRLGWLLCPADLVDEIADLKLRTDRGSPGLEQLVLARLIESGRFDRHLRRMRKAYAAKRDAVLEAVTEYAPGVHVSGLAAGFHAVASLPPDRDEATVIEQARQRQVGLYGMSPNRSTRAADPPQLVLGFGNVPERAIRDGIARVGDILAG